MALLKVNHLTGLGHGRSLQPDPSPVVSSSGGDRSSAIVGESPHLIKDPARTLPECVRGIFLGGTAGAGVDRRARSR
jgi:hypothetical protein